MSDHARVAGKTSQSIELGGKTCTLRPYVVGLWAEMSAFVRGLKGDPIKEVCDRLDAIPPEQQPRWMRAAVEAAANQTPSEQELAAFENSLLGTAFRLWSTLKANHLKDFPSPYAVMDELVSLTEGEGRKKLNEILLKLEVASGEADLKKLRWPARDAGLTPQDGEPLYGGWPAFYKFFFERFHWTIEDVHACPVYLACLLLGAISPDHTNVRMTFKDTLRYYANDQRTMDLLKLIGNRHVGQAF